jgi:hypothetical protein
MLGGMNTDTWRTDAPPRPVDDGLATAVEAADTIEANPEHRWSAQAPAEDLGHALGMAVIAQTLASRGHAVAMSATPRTGGIVEYTVGIAVAA